MKYLARLIVIGMIAVLWLAVASLLDKMIAGVIFILLLVSLIAVLIRGSHYPGPVDFR